MSKPQNQNDAAIIRKTAEQFTVAANAGHGEGWSALYADNAVFMPPNHAPVRGKAAIGKYMQESFFNPFKVRIQDRMDDLVINGDLAVRRGTALLTLTPKGGGAVIDDECNYLEAWQRQSDGSWRVIHDIFNSARAARQ